MLWHSIFYSRFLLHINANSWKYISRRHERGMIPQTNNFRIFVLVFSGGILDIGKMKSLKSFIFVVVARKHRTKKKLFF